ncbi:hypothetical protein [Nocardioides sp. Iso805N]|uniref:hypothetical protein n=1 Tax=Nocardioides sp. Iso805N TaxID=1283287 RepID=UPI0003A7DE66|nr:hypothetical protein [Nocardioides sp. Iso805N]
MTTRAAGPRGLPLARYGAPIGALILALATAAPAVAATAGWVGADGDDWSAGSSWSIGAPPVDGDAVTFPIAPPDASSVDDLPNVTLGGITSAGAWTVEPANDAAVTLAGPMSVDLAGQDPEGSRQFLWLVPLITTEPVVITSSYDAGILSLRAPVTGGQPLTVAGPGQVLFQRGPNAISDLVVDGATAGRADLNVPDASPATARVEPGAALGFGDGTYDFPIEVGGDGTASPVDPSSWAPGALRVRSNGQDVQPVLAGPVTLTAAATFATAAATDTSALTFAGPVDGGAPLTVVGAGTMTFSGSVSVASLTSTVRRLVVTGPVDGPVSVGAGSTISGSGSVAGLEVNPDGGLDVTVDGDTSSHLTSSGPVTVNGALTVDATSLPATGQQVLLVDNRSGQPVTGTFAGLPEGASLTLGGEPWQISYVGGDGNDIVIRRTVDATPSSTPSPTASVAPTQKPSTSEAEPTLLPVGSAEQSPAPSPTPGAAALSSAPPQDWTTGPADLADTGSSLGRAAALLGPALVLAGAGMLALRRRARRLERGREGGR